MVTTTSVWQFRYTAPDHHTMFQRHFNEDSLTTSRAFWNSGWTSSTSGARPPSSCLTSSVILPPVMGKSSPSYLDSGCFSACILVCTCVYLCSRGPMICHWSETKYCYSWSLLSSTRCIMRCFTSSIIRWCLWWPPLCFGALFFIYLFINSVAIRFHIVKWHRRGKRTGTFVCLHWLSPRTSLPSIFLSNSKQ